MTTSTVDEAARKCCETIHAETGQEARLVNAEWQLPSWNGLLNTNSTVHVGRPSCWFQPLSAHDVTAACRAASRCGLKISARGSGHHYGGASMVDGALLLDLSKLASVQVDASSRTARAGPAASARQLRSALAPLGLHFPLPHLSDVGLSGYILGGGNGWGVRQYGAAADNVVEMEVVLLADADTAAGRRAGGGGVADGDGDGDGGGQTAGGGGGGGSGGGGGCSGPEQGCRLVRVSAESDPELFWGLCGGGSFLGVVTEFVLRLHPVPGRLPLIAATYPPSRLGELAEFFRGFHSANPPSVEASMSIVGTGGDSDSGVSSTAGGGSGPAEGVRTVVVLACTSFAEPGSDEVEAAYAKLRALLPDVRLSVQEGPVPYEEALSVLDSSWSWPGLCMYGHGIFVPVPSLRGRVGGGGGCAATAGTGTSTAGTGDDADSADQPSVVSALAAAAAGMTSRRSILLVCPSAPSRPGSTTGCGSTSAASAVSGCGPGGSDPWVSQLAHGSFGFRDMFYMGIYAMWTRSEGGPAADGDARHVAWVRACAASLAADTAGLYVNEVMHDDPGQVRRSYEEATYARLRALKRRVDPRGLLRAL